MRSRTIATSSFSLFAWVFLSAQVVSANPLCVTSDKANLRSGPGTNFKVTWTVPKYMPLKQIGSKGTWLKVNDLDGEEHWIASNMVTSRIQCVVVKAKYANLRKRPSANGEAADIPIADRYTPFRKVQREESWLFVEDDYKQRYWVSDATVWWPVNRSRMTF